MFRSHGSSLNPPTTTPFCSPSPRLVAVPQPRSRTFQRPSTQQREVTMAAITAGASEGRPFLFSSWSINNGCHSRLKHRLSQQQHRCTNFTHTRTHTHTHAHTDTQTHTHTHTHTKSTCLHLPVVCKSRFVFCRQGEKATEAPNTSKHKFKRTRTKSKRKGERTRIRSAGYGQHHPRVYSTTTTATTTITSNTNSKDNATAAKTTT